jgi:hypothetical protein
VRSPTPPSPTHPSPVAEYHSFRSSAVGLWWPLSEAGHGHVAGVPGSGLGPAITFKEMGERREAARIAREADRTEEEARVAAQRAALLRRG